jgi:hypothetical protein
MRRSSQITPVRSSQEKMHRGVGEFPDAGLGLFLPRWIVNYLQDVLFRENRLFGRVLLAVIVAPVSVLFQYAAVHGYRSAKPAADSGQRTPQAPVHLPLRKGRDFSLLFLHPHHSRGPGLGHDPRSIRFWTWEGSTTCISGLVFRYSGHLDNSLWLDVCGFNHYRGKVHCSEEALDILLYLGLRAVFVATVWDCSWRLHHSGSQSSVSESPVQSEATSIALRPWTCRKQRAHTS